MSETQKFNIDHEFVGVKEDNRIHLYVPEESTGIAFPESGITIGKGFDLASKSVDTLRDMKISEATISKLKPYLGLKGQKAYNYLKKAGEIGLPIFESSEIEDLNRKAFSWYAANIAGQYEAKSEGNKFMDLTRAQQTVLFSVGYQYGSFKRKDGSDMNFIKQAAKGNWKGVYSELMNFNDKHPTRRKSEAALLSKEDPNIL